VVAFDDIVGVKECFIVAYGVLYLLSDSVCNYVIDLILVLMESNGFVGYVAAFDHFTASGIGEEMFAEIVIGFLFVGSDGVQIVD
jgi:hypothetical protein